VASLGNQTASCASSATFVLGTTAMEGYPYADFTRDGKWHEFEIPMSYFKGKGLTYTTGMTQFNVFDFLAGGAVGEKEEPDAICMYKKP
jgi:hypothetical protein